MEEFLSWVTPGEKEPVFIQKEEECVFSGGAVGSLYIHTMECIHLRRSGRKEGSEENNLIE